MTRFQSLEIQYSRAVKRLEEILMQEKTDITRDSAVKRFEFTFDLSWKLLKTYLEETKGILCSSPKECFREGYRVGLLEYDEFWITMTDLRNEAVHSYSELFSNALYAKLPEALKHFQFLKKITSEK